MPDDETKDQEQQADDDNDGSDEGVEYEDAQGFGDYDDSDDLLDAFQELAEEIDGHGVRLTKALKGGQLNDPEVLAAELVETVMNFLRDLAQISFDAAVEAIESGDSDDEQSDEGKAALSMLMNLRNYLVLQLREGTPEQQQAAANMLQLLGVPKEALPVTPTSDGQASADTEPAPEQAAAAEDAKADEPTPAPPEPEPEKVTEAT